MRGERNFWFRLGATVERLRQGVPAGRQAHAGREETDEAPRGRRSARARPGEAAPQVAPRRRAPVDPGRRPGWASLLREGLRDGTGGELGEFLASPLGGLTAAGSGTLALRSLQRWADRRRPSIGLLAAAAGAGIGAAVAREAITALLQRELPEDPAASLPEALLEGAGEGMLFAALVEPILRLPPVVQGALLGSASYATGPWGGMGVLLSPMAPYRSVPVLARLLDGEEGERRRERIFLAELGYGITLALLYRGIAGAVTSDRESDREWDEG